MQRPPFFPDPYFGWTFYAVLVAFTLLGAYLDLRKAVLPKTLTLSLLAVGVVFNIVRGAWLGQIGGELRWLSTGSLWLGALDGFLFSLLGFVLTTVLFFVMWAMKLCGGGDVKLFAALGRLGRLLVRHLHHARLGPRDGGHAVWPRAVRRTQADGREKTHQGIAGDSRRAGQGQVEDDLRPAGGDLGGRRAALVLPFRSQPGRSPDELHPGACGGPQ